MNPFVYILLHQRTYLDVAAERSHTDILHLDMQPINVLGVSIVIFQKQAHTPFVRPYQIDLILHVAIFSSQA